MMKVRILKKEPDTEKEKEQKEFALLKVLLRDYRKVLLLELEKKKYQVPFSGVDVVLFSDIVEVLGGEKK